MSLAEADLGSDVTKFVARATEEADLAFQARRLGFLPPVTN